MTEAQLRRLLQAVQGGELTVEAGVSSVLDFAASDASDVKVDVERQQRCGHPEAIWGETKSDAQILDAIAQLHQAEQLVLVTRVNQARAESLRARAACALVVHGRANCLHSPLPESKLRGRVGVVCAGSSDMRVADEAALVCGLSGVEVSRFNDIGVAGLHRLLARLETLRTMHVLVVVAGMEGALPTVITGLVSCPVIAVPTSVGYGAGHGGIAALLGMLSGCAAGSTVVNIDNGFGAGVAAVRMIRAAESMSIAYDGSAIPNDP